MAERIRLNLEGLDDLLRQLRELPEHVRKEASRIVTGHAQRAMSEMQTAYPIRNYGRLRNRGRLQASLKIETRSDNFSSAAILRNRAPHAYLFEHGTAARHTAQGISRGAARPGRVFIPIAVDHKELMIADLMDLIEASGPFRINRAQAA